MGTALFVLVLILLLGRLNMHQTTLLWQLKEPKEGPGECSGEIPHSHLLNKLGRNRLDQKNHLHAFQGSPFAFFLPKRGLTGPVWRRKPASMVPVIGLKEPPRIGGFSIRERRLLLSWEPGKSIIPGRSGRKLLSFSFTFFPQNLL